MKNFKRTMIKIIEILAVILLVMKAKSIAFVVPRYNTNRAPSGGYAAMYTNPNSKYLPDLLGATHSKLSNSYVPFYWIASGRSVGYPNVASILNATSFSVYVSNNYVYCSDYACTVREGKFDNNVWWVAEEYNMAGKSMTIAQAKQHELDIAKNYIQNKVRSWEIPVVDQYADGTYINTYNLQLQYVEGDIQRITVPYAEDYGTNWQKYLKGWYKITESKVHFGERQFVTNHSLYVLPSGAPGVPRESDVVDYDNSAFAMYGESIAASYARHAMQSFIDKIAGSPAKAANLGDYSLNPNGVNTNDIPFNAMHGPRVTVVESGDTTGTGDTGAAGYTFGAVTRTTGGLAYALTAMRRLYNPYSADYDPCDIQAAWWILVDSESAIELIGDGISTSFACGTGLAAEALAYHRFYNNYANTIYYNLKVLRNPYGTTTEAIINHKDQTYTIGPFAVDLPGYTPAYAHFVYLKQLVIKTSGDDSNTTLYYNHTRKDFEILYPEPNSSITGSNGLSGEYPLFNRLFYVRFSTSKVNHPTRIDLTGNVEYLRSASISISTAGGAENTAVTYEYIGHYEGDLTYDNHHAYEDLHKHDDCKGNHSCAYNAPVVTVTYDISKPTHTRRQYIEPTYYPAYYYVEYINQYNVLSRFEVIKSECDVNNDNKVDDTFATPTLGDKYGDYKGKTIKYQRRTLRTPAQYIDGYIDSEWVGGYNIYIITGSLWIQPWIKMCKDPINQHKAQAFTQAGSDGVRTYQSLSKSTAMTFTMNIEGTVFLDAREGKNSEPNGMYTPLAEPGSGRDYENRLDDTQDYGMRGITVILYRHDLGEVGKLGDNTKRGTPVRVTRTNTYGKYSFSNLNEMYKYHVEFLYNGQFFEPTKCTTKVTYNNVDPNNKFEYRKGEDGPVQEYGPEAQWNMASKAIDNNDERNAYNAKFEEVGSANQNVILNTSTTYSDDSRVYTYKSGTKEELIDAGVIETYRDISNNLYDYGNISGLRVTIENGKEKITYTGSSEYSGYALETLTRAYTARDKDNRMIFDLYPFEHVFVANKTVLSEHNKVATGVKPLYGQSDTDKNLLQSINLGLTPREEIDLSLQKDVYEIIFELNGKEYIYKYNTRYAEIPEGVSLEDYYYDPNDPEHTGMRGQLAEANKLGYAVATRIKDRYAYYKEEDLRYVYREDYQYNAGIYNQLYVTDENGNEIDVNDDQYRAFIEAKRNGELEIYVKYRITLKNSSSGINARVTEVVDHSDKEFTLITSSRSEGLSEDDATGAKVIQGKVIDKEVNKYRPYIGYKGKVLTNAQLATWENSMVLGDKVEQQFSGVISGTSPNYSFVGDAPYLKTSNSSIYKTTGGTNVEYNDFSSEYNTHYITGMENIYLTTRFTSIDLYLTYRVNKEKADNALGEYIILDEVVDGLARQSSEDPKSNLAEIRGYKTYYSTSAKAPNRDNTENDIRAEFIRGENQLNKDEIAGILDKNSTPGNLKFATRGTMKTVEDSSGQFEVEEEVFNVAKENDADRAPLLRIILNDENSREVTGSTFEDSRNKTYDDSEAVTGDGVKDGNDRAINGMRVQLIELDPKPNEEPGYIETIWKEVKVGDNEQLTPVLNNLGLIGNYGLKYTTKKRVDGTTERVDTGIDDSTGLYRILGFPTGDFIIRFIYGSDADTAVGTNGYNYLGYTDGDGNPHNIGYGVNEIEKIATYDITSNLRRPVKDPTINIYTDAEYDYRLNLEDVGSPKDNRSTNSHSYTGNDYKSTSYREGFYEAYIEGDHAHITEPTEEIIDYENAVTGDYEFSFIVNDATDNSGNTLYLSDAKDITARREEVINYSKKDQMNHISEVLASFEEKQPAGNDEIDIFKGYLQELYERTYMYADSGVIHVNGEYYTDNDEDNRDDSLRERANYNPSDPYANMDERRNSLEPQNGIGANNYDRTGFYTIANLDFGIEERPKAQLKTNVEVASVKIILSNGNVQFDSITTATNLQWQPHVGHGQDSANTYTKDNNYQEAEPDSIGMLPTNNKKFMKIPKVRTAGNNGIILATMDQELMQGATIQVTYNVTVANIGEVDYTQNEAAVNKKYAWYNKHYLLGADDDIVTTTAKELICYVGSQIVDGELSATDQKSLPYGNIQFATANNLNSDNKPIWEKLSDGMAVGAGLVNDRYSSQLKKYDNIIHTTEYSDFNKPLIPVIVDDNSTKVQKALDNDPLNAMNTTVHGNKCQSVAGEQLVLSTVISGDSTSNDMTYNNLVELVRIDNTVGRRLGYSILGNQDPLQIPREIDTDISEEISIIPPFGGKQINYYLGFGLAGIILLGTSIVLVFNKKKD